MKKWLCFGLVFALIAALGVPALAGSMDSAMAEVTLAVKQTLDVGDEYTDFSGDWDDWMGGCWSLYWSGDTQSLSVTADAGGKVMDCWSWRSSGSSDRFYGFDAQFPALSEEQAEETAQQWLARLMGEGESARIDTRRTDLDGGTYCYGGTVCLNGLDSPITFSLVIFGDGTLRSYSRSDAYGGYVGALPAAQAQTDETAAAGALEGTVALELYWVSDGAGRASLRYVPAFARHIVDAESGECVDMDARYGAFNDSGYGPDMAVMATEAAAMAGGAGNGLTEVELSSVQGYGEALTADELDAALRGIDELGLNDGFASVNVRYSQTDSGDIYCDLTYAKTMTDDQLYGYSRENYDEAVSWGDDLTIRKYIRVNAKSAAIESLSTSYPLWERDDTLTDSGDRTTAEAFLKQAAADELDESALCTLSDWADGTVWAQVKSGYFYPENRLVVEINAASGTVDRYERVWEDDVSFGRAKPVAEKKAVAAYIDALELTLGYAAWPTEAAGEYAEYAENYGYDWVEQLKLAWYYAGTDAVAGVDAVTGEIVRETEADDAFVYTDLENCGAAEAIERLGAAGIGFSSGRFDPEQPLDMRAAATMLLQAVGYTISDWDDERLGEAFASQGMIEPGQWAPDAVLSRMDFLKLLLTASRYGDACRLAGVWRTDYDDAAEIDAADMGYAAVAQALALVADGALRPAEICTRAMAAQMLCAFLQRG